MFIISRDLISGKTETSTQIDYHHFFVCVCVYVHNISICFIQIYGFFWLKMKKKSRNVENKQSIVGVCLQTNLTFYKWLILFRAMEIINQKRFGHSRWMNATGGQSLNAIHAFWSAPVYDTVNGLSAYFDFRDFIQLALLAQIQCDTHDYPSNQYIKSHRPLPYC